MVKWSKVRWEGHLAHGTRIKNVIRRFCWKIEEREQLGDLELEGKTIFESYSKLIIESRIHLYQDTCRWLALVDAVMDIRGNFIDQLNDYHLTKHDLLHGLFFLSCLYLDRVLTGIVLNLARNLNRHCVQNGRSVSDTADGGSDSAYLSCCGHSPSSGSPPARRTYCGCRRIWVQVGRAERSARRLHSWKTCHRSASRSAGSSRSHGDSPR